MVIISTAAEITETLNSFTSKPNGIPGIVFRAVRKDGSRLYEGASGVQGIDHKDHPMTTNTIFWIASCTKLVTAIAALQLVEQGKISLNDHVEKYIPEISKLPILTGFDAEDKPILKEAKTKVTIHHLLTHTSGLNYNAYNAIAKKYSEMNHIPKFSGNDRSGLFCPLSFEPGTDWEYGTNLDWVGLIIEKVTGQALGTYMQNHIFGPLGSHSTTFSLTDEQISRHARLHMRAPNDSLSEVPTSDAWTERPKFHNGGGGLHSIAADYTAVLRSLLNDGEGPNGPNGLCILKKESVDLLFADQTPSMAGISLDKPLISTIPEVAKRVTLPSTPKAWTYGGMTYKEAIPTGRSVGSVFWSGTPNCYWWLDSAKGIAGVFLTQLIPTSDAEVKQCFAQCEQLVYAGL